MLEWAVTVSFIVYDALVCPLLLDGRSVPSWQVGRVSSRGQVSWC